MSRTVWVALPGADCLQQTQVEDLIDLQELVDGWIESVPVFDDFTVWVNEEGKLRGLYPNVAWPDAGDVLHGVVIFDGGIDDEGDTLDITQEQLERARAFHKKNRL